MVLVSKKQQAQPVHHRKRHGQHHKRTKTYEKHYWPYLPLLGIIGIGFVLNMFWTPLSQKLTRQHVLGYTTNTSVQGLLEETNTRRSASHEAGLRLNAQLAAAAQAKADDMALRNYWSHVTPDGVQPWQFVTNAGYGYKSLGENLAYGFDSSAQTVSGLMNSPEHRDNLLNKTYDDVGFGIANASNYQGKGDQTVVVAMYGKSDRANSTIGVTMTVRPQDGSQAQAAAATGQSTVATQTNEPVNPIRLTTSSQPVARLQLVGYSLPAWSFWLAVAVINLLAVTFIVRHAAFMHRALVKGERFIVRHPAVDMIIVAVITFGVLLTRTAGFIQ